jgi:hypothetical protein
VRDLTTVAITSTAEENHEVAWSTGSPPPHPKFHLTYGPSIQVSLDFRMTIVLHSAFTPLLRHSMNGATL